MNNSTDNQSTRGRFSARDLLPFALALAAGVVCYSLFWRRGIWLSVVGYSVSPAERVVAGEAPYRDFLYNYTPGILWINALTMRLFGASLLAVSGALFAFKLAALIALFFLARRLTNSWTALAPVALTLGWIGYKYVFGVYPTQYSLVFALIGLICMLRYDESDSAVWLLLCGIAVGAVFVFKYNVGILLVGAGTAAVAIRELARGKYDRRGARIFSAMKKAAVYWAGFALTFGAMAAYLARQGAFGAMIDHFLHHVLAYSQERAIPPPHPRQTLIWVGGLGLGAIGALVALRFAPKLFEAYLVSVVVVLTSLLLIPDRAFVVKNSATATVAYLPIFLFVVTLGVIVFQLRRKKESADRWTSIGPMVIVGLFALGIYLEVYPRADYYHLVRVLPPVFVLMVMLIHRAMPLLESLFENRLPSPRRSAMLCAAAPLALLMVIGFRESWQPHFDRWFHFRDDTSVQTARADGMLVPPRQAEMIERLTRLIDENSAPDEYIFSFSQRGTAFHFLAGRRNPTRFVWWRSVGIRRETREAALEIIRARKPKLVILQDSLKDQRVRETVGANYTEVGRVEGLSLLTRKEAGE